MKLRFVKLDPTRNMTLLVETPVPAALRRGAADFLMAGDPEIEQVGFLESPPPGAEVSLQMVGGEFCGNASLCAAALYLQRRGLSSARVCLRASGAAQPVRAEISGGDGQYRGTVAMPLPQGAEEQTFSLDGRTLTLPVVRFGGISHILAREDALSEREAQRAIRLWCDALGAEGLGILLLDGTLRRMRPLVYIPGSDTLFWEHSCASGTCAVGVWEALREKRTVRVILAQPGGTLEAEAEYRSGTITALTLHGGVKLLEDRETDWDPET